MTDDGPDDNQTPQPAHRQTPPEGGGPPMAISEEFRRFEPDDERPSLFTDKVAFLLFALAAPVILLVSLGSGVVDPDLRDDVPGDPGIAVTDDRLRFESVDRPSRPIRVGETSRRGPIVSAVPDGESRLEVIEQADGDIVVERRTDRSWLLIAVGVVVGLTLAAGLWFAARRRLGSGLN